MKYNFKKIFKLFFIFVVLTLISMYTYVYAGNDYDVYSFTVSCGHSSVSKTGTLYAEIGDTITATTSLSYGSRHVYCCGVDSGENRSTASATPSAVGTYSAYANYRQTSTYTKEVFRVSIVVLNIPVAPTIKASSGLASGAWRKVSETLTFSGGVRDANNPITNYRYRTSTNGGASYSGWTVKAVSSPSMTVSTVGSTIVQVQACTVHGNYGATTSYTVNIDDKAPTISIGAQPGWSNTSCTISWSGADDVGVSSYDYTFNKSNIYSLSGDRTSITWNKTTSPNGVYGTAIYLRAVDNAGNVSAWSEARYIRLDFSLPTITPGTQPEWSNTTCTLKWSGADTGSGVQKYQWSYDKSNVTDFGTGTSKTWNKTTDPSGLYNKAFYVRAVDNVGNVGAWYEAGKIRLDTIGPTITPGTQPGWSNTSCTLTWSGSDNNGNGSGIAKYQWSYDKSSVTDIGTDTSKTWTINDYPNGTTSYSTNGRGVYVRAVDNLGNVGAWSDVRYIKIDLDFPTIGTLILKYKNNSGANYTAGTVSNYIIYVDAINGSDAQGSCTTLYTIDDSTWKEAGTPTYIDRSGTYNVILKTTDASGNFVTATKKVIVDRKIEVTLTFSNVKDLGVGVKDINIYAKASSVSDSKYTLYKTLSNPASSVSTTITLADNNYDIKVICSDRVGNINNTIKTIKTY